MTLDDAAGQALYADRHPELAATDEALTAWGQGVQAGQRKAINALRAFIAGRRITAESRAYQTFLTDYENSLLT